MKTPLRSMTIAVALAVMLTGAGASPASAKTPTTGKVGLTFTTPGGAGVPKVKVTIAAKSVVNPGGAAEGHVDYSNINGRVVTPELAPGTYSVTAQLKEPVAITKTVEMTVTADVNSQLVVALPGIQAIMGTVTAGGVPVSARVNATDGKSVYGMGTILGGQYKLIVKPGVAYTVVARPYRGASVPWVSTYAGDTVRKPDAKKITPATSAPTTLDIRAFDEVGMIRGQVFNAGGQLVKNSTVSVCATDRYGCARASVNDEGGFAVRGLPAGTYTLHASTRTAYGSVERITVAAGASTRKSVTVRTPSQQKPADPGRILLALSAPSAVVEADQACVTLFDPRGTAAEWACLEPGQTKIAFTGLAAGTYRLALDGANSSRSVIVRKDAIASLSMTRSSGTTLTGRITTSSGAPAKEAAVYVSDGNDTSLGVVTTSSTGTYRIPFATSGSYRIAVYPTSGSDVPLAKTVRLSGARPVVNAALAGPATVTGKVVNSAGKPVAGLRVAVSTDLDYHTTTTDAQGKYTVRGVAAGAARVETYDLYMGGYRNTRSPQITTVNGRTTTTNVTVRD